MKYLNHKLSQLIDILNDGQYHDGNSLGEHLSITRSGVWKLVKKLSAYGITIQSVKGKGYLLPESLNLLNKQQIKKQLQVKNIRLEIFEAITSTNTYLKTIKANKQTNVCIAEYQTEGRGRFNRKWESPFGQNIYLSQTYFLKKDISEYAGLSLVVSLAMRAALQKFIMSEAIKIKWPNDLMVQHKKLAGNLIEVESESNGFGKLIIGVGCNINMMCASSNHKNAISLRMISNQKINRNLFCAELINQLDYFLNQFEKNGMAFFIEKWNEADYLKGTMITLTSLNKKIHGKATGIDYYGRLLIQLKDGTIFPCSSGDTTIGSRIDTPF